MGGKVADAPLAPYRSLGLIETQDKNDAKVGKRRKAAWVAGICVALLILAAIPVALVIRSTRSAQPKGPVHYLGVYERGVPSSYAGVNAFTTATGVRPNLLMYYSTWEEPFHTGFAATAAEHGATALVQINPYGVSLAGIASGQYDGYLSSFAKAVRSFRRPVVLSFGHEMNGTWYPWANTHQSPANFVAAWRHIVTLFRTLGARNVTWLWTVNIIVADGGVPSPAPWWPGSSYVNWVGIDGYYYSQSVNFASLFGPTIAAVRGLTGNPILIAETAVKSTADQPAKIPDLFAGVRLYGLLGFIWFAAQDWRFASSAAVAAFRQGARAYQGPAS